MPYRRHKEGEPLDSTSLQDNLTEMENKVNNVRRERLIRKALRREHIPSYVPPEYDWTTLFGRRGLAVLGVNGERWVGASYRRQIPPAPTDNAALVFTNWQLFDPSPIGPVTGSITPVPSSWRIPRATSTAGVTQFDTEAVRAIPAGALQEHNILANFSMNLTEVGRNATQAPSYDPTAALVCIGLRGTPSQYYCIERSIRIFKRSGFQFGDVGTFCLITQEDVDDFETHFGLTPGTANISQVFAAISSTTVEVDVALKSGSTPRLLGVNNPNVGGVFTDRWNFDILPVQKGGID